jgi:hypothetical protein
MREDSMRVPPAFLPIALALGAIILAPVAGARAQDEQEGPIAIEKCLTDAAPISQPGSYRLVNNLTMKGVGTCLSITADFVTIDLSGFTITGPNQVPGPIILGTAIRDLGDNSVGITVRNGSIRGFAAGVNLRGSGSLVEGLRVSLGNGGGIIANGIVRGNTVLFSGLGFSPLRVGILATGTITGNHASGTPGTAIQAGQGSTVIGNTAPGPGAVGISVDCPSNVTDNTAVGSSTNLVLNGQGCNNTNNVAP